MGEYYKSLTAEVRIPESKQRVWDALTDAKQLSSWFAQNAEVDLDSGVYSFWGIHTPETPEQGSSKFKLQGYEEAARLAFQWNLRGSDSEVEYTLEESDGSVLLKLSHKNLVKRPEDDGAMHDFWYASLEALRMYVLSGRQQEQCDYRRKKGSTVECGVTVSGPADAAYGILTSEKQMGRLFNDTPTIEPEVGGTYSLGWPDGGPIKILDLQQGAKLAYSWKFGEKEDETVVTWALDESGGRTRMTIVHSGFPEDFESEGYRAGWFSFLMMIKAMVELGETWSRVDIKGIAHGEA